MLFLTRERYPFDHILVYNLIRWVSPKPIAIAHLNNNIERMGFIRLGQIPFSVGRIGSLSLGTISFSKRNFFNTFEVKLIVRLDALSDLPRKHGSFSIHIEILFEIESSTLIFF